MELQTGSSEERYGMYAAGLVSLIRHADRAKPLRDYCVGLTMPRAQDIEPMATLTAPERAAAQHQSPLHFVGEGGWRDEAVLAKVREMVLRSERHGPSKRGSSAIPVFRRRDAIR